MTMTRREEFPDSSGRIALESSAVVFSIALCPAQYRSLIAFIGMSVWAIQLIDIHLAAVQESAPASYWNGWPLLAVSVLAGLLRFELGWVYFPVWSALLIISLFTWLNVWRIHRKRS